MPQRPDLPLHVGYYAGRRPYRLLDLVTFGIRSRETPADDAPWTLESKPGSDFAAQQKPWRTQGTSVAVDQGLGRITVTDPDRPWGAAILRVRPGIRGKAGSIRLTVPRVDSAWALKMNAGGDDIVIQGESRQKGTFVYRLDELPGSRDRDEFDLKIFAIGKDKSVWIESVSVEIRKEPVVTPADAVQHDWYPYKLAFMARYDNSGPHVAGCDFLADENTVVRLISNGERNHPKGQTWHTGGRILQFHGVLHGEVVPNSSALVVQHDDYFYAMILGETTGQELMPAAFKATPQIRGGEWHLETTLSEDRDITAAFAAIGFATRAEGMEAAVGRVSRIFSGPGLAQRLKEQKIRWNDYLRRVPAPEQFGIQAVDPKGVTPETHRRFYYGAWTFAISNLLPQMPENDYPYPQTPAGKPSLWNFGASKAPASAAWESFFGQQLLAYVMPDAAWAAFEGIMAQVDQTGWLDGECLPSRKAQTAWILYSLTGDTERLRRVYPTIKRYLFWREKNPRWIYLEHNNIDEKDASFVDQLLVDIDFAARIAKTIGEDADIDLWQQRREAILKDYREWFFFTDGRPPVELFFTESKRHSPGNPSWVVSGLHIRDLPADLLADLKQLYLKRHRPDHDLCGIGGTKYGTESFTAYGLIEQGLFKEAREFINAQLRDQIRAVEFSENYAAGRDGPPLAWGVKPSLFGVIQMIDFTLMNNGVRIDQGFPIEFKWPDSNQRRPDGSHNPPAGVDGKGG